MASEALKYVKPKAEKVTILRGGSDAGKSMIIYLDEAPVQLSAGIDPFDAVQDVKWSSSNKKIVKVSADGLLTPVKTGKVTITATARDGSKKKDTITITVKQMVRGIEISGKDMLASSLSATLKAKVSPSNASNKTIRWTSSDPSIATVNSKGVVKAAKGLTERRQVVITATAKDGSGVYARHTITVCPKVTSVQLVQGGADAGKKVQIDLTGGPDTLQLDKLIAPANAIQDVKWSSSNKKIATVDANGLVKGIKPGTATITVAAQDGSKKKDTISVTVTRLMSQLSITGKADVLTAGRKLTLKAACLPKNATNKAVTWKSSDPAVATVNAKGVVTAKNVSARKQVIITATAKDGSGVSAVYTITVYPKASSAALYLNGSALSSTEDVGFLGKGQTLKLSASLKPADAVQDVKWTSSNKKIAKVSADGTVTILKKGSVVITATAQDGSKKSAKVKLKIS